MVSAIHNYPITDAPLSEEDCPVPFDIIGKNGYETKSEEALKWLLKKTYSTLCWQTAALDQRSINDSPCARFDADINCSTYIPLFILPLVARIPSP